MCLASTDSYAAGCISSYIESALSPEKIAILQKCHDDLQHAMDAEVPDHVRAYFVELCDIAKMVLNDVG